MVKRLIACIIIIVIATSLIGGFNAFADEAQAGERAEETSCSCVCCSYSKADAALNSILCYFFITLMTIAFVFVVAFALV